MKQLTGLVALLFIIGVGGFLYRNAIEKEGLYISDTAMVGCTEEAKMCPDGTGVAREGTLCRFPVCPLPNKEVSELEISFLVPVGYVENKNAPNEDLKIAFEKTSSPQNTPHAIVIRRFPISPGLTGNEIMLTETMFESSGNKPKGMQDFKPVIIQGRTFQSIVVERFEGMVHSLYYLPRATDVLRFEILERNVDWTNPKLVVSDLPEHKAFLNMLSTLLMQ